MTENDFSVKYEDIAAAAGRLDGVAKRTPVMTSRQMNEAAGANIFFKCENFQRVGAFKFRGAYNALSCFNATQKQRGALAYSSGNHAQGMALAGKLLGVPVTVLMPADAPALKVAATREYGAEIIFYDRFKENREAMAADLAQARRLTLIPSFDHRDIIAGQGTAAKELIEEVGEIDYLFVPVGGGGLISGSAIAASHLSARCLVIGVEPEAGNDAQQSFRKGEIVTIPVPKTIADGAQTTSVGQLTFPIIREKVHDIVTVSDDQLRAQMKFFAERMKIIVEPTGCLGAAAVSNRLVDIVGKRAGVILSGGNVSLSQLVLG